MANDEEIRQPATVSKNLANYLHMTTPRSRGQSDGPRIATSRNAPSTRPSTTAASTSKRERFRVEVRGRLHGPRRIRPWVTAVSASVRKPNTLIGVELPNRTVLPSTSGRSCSL